MAIRPLPTGTPLDLNPYEFEEYCAAALRERGWEARTTKKSGDQGIDVIASRNGKKVVIQCKRFRGSVGNAAVQEAIAGMRYEKADYAAVITTGSYTRAAKELASQCDVQLLTLSSLTLLDNLAFTGSSASRHSKDYIANPPEIGLVDHQKVAIQIRNQKIKSLESGLADHNQKVAAIIRNQKIKTLHIAVEANNLEMVAQFIAEGADVNGRGLPGLSPLHLAAKFGNYEITRLLIQKGADVNAKRLGVTPLMMAAVASKRVTGALIEAGANVKVIGKNGKTALHFAIEAGNKVTSDLLIWAGADDSRQNGY